MALFKTSNPALSSNTSSGMSDSSYGGGISSAPYGEAISTTSMTLSGTVNKTGILLVLAVVAAFTWNQFAATHDPASVSLEMLVGVFGGFIFALITTFKREWSPVTAPIYALLEGLFLGAFSAMLDLRYPGIAFLSKTAPASDSSEWCPRSLCARA